MRHVKSCVYLVGSVLAVFAMLINIVFQFLYFQLDFIVLLSYFICLCALPLKISDKENKKKNL